MINVVTYVFFGLFVISSLVEIIVAFNEVELVRKIVKPFSLLFLAIAVIVTLPTHPLIYIGALLGMVGDILLIFNKNRKLFLVGTVIFLLGHFAYLGEVLFVMMKQTPMEWWFYVVVVFYVTDHTSSVSLFKKDYQQSVFGPTRKYLSINLNLSHSRFTNCFVKRLCKLYGFRYCGRHFLPCK